MTKTICLVTAFSVKGGPDKALRIGVLLCGCDKVVLTVYGSDLPLIDKAAARIKLRLSSAIAKARHFDPRQSIPGSL